MEAEQLSISTIKQYKRSEITGVERFQRLIDTWHRTSERLKQEVIENFEATDILNPVYMMAFSGARGNISQVRQLVGMRGLMSNPQGQIIDFPIRSNFREGLTLTEYIISSYGARKGIVDTALRTANAGYLTRRLVDVAQHVIISNFDCGTKRGIFLTDMKEGNKTIYSLQNRLIGRVLARDVFKNGLSSGVKIASRNVEISSDLSISLASICKKVFVRSALTCQTKNLVCQLCYGWSLAQGTLVGIGEAVGVVAAQSIGEPGTQLTMRTFHTGGVFSGDVSDQIRAPFNGIVIYDNPIAGTLVRTPEGKIGFLTKNEGSFTVFKNQLTLPTKLIKNPQLSSIDRLSGESLPCSKKFKIPFYTLLFFKNGEKVIEKEVIAQISSINRQKNATDQAEFTINAELSGQFFSKFLNLKENKVGPKLKGALLKQSYIKKKKRQGSCPPISPPLGGVSPQKRFLLVIPKSTPLVSPPLPKAPLVRGGKGGSKTNLQLKVHSTKSESLRNLPITPPLRHRRLWLTPPRGGGYGGVNDAEVLLLKNKSSKQPIETQAKNFSNEDIPYSSPSKVPSEDMARKNKNSFSSQNINVSLHRRKRSNGQRFKKISNSLIFGKDEIILEEFDETIVDTIFESWGWGYAWVLSGKIYQLPLSSTFFPIIGDFVNHKTYMNKNKLSLPSNFGTSVKLNIPLPNSIGHNVFFNNLTIKKIRAKYPLQGSLNEGIENYQRFNKLDPFLYMNSNHRYLWKGKKNLYNNNKNFRLSQLKIPPVSTSSIDTKDQGTSLLKNKVMSNVRQQVSDTNFQTVNRTELKFKGTNFFHRKKGRELFSGYPKDLTLLKTQLISFQLSKITYQKLGYFLKLSPHWFKKVLPPINFLPEQKLVKSSSIFSHEDKLFLFSSLAKNGLATNNRVLSKKSVSVMTHQTNNSPQALPFGNLPYPPLWGGIKQNKFPYPVNWLTSFDSGIFLNWFPKRFSTNSSGLILIEPIVLKYKTINSKIWEKNNKISVFIKRPKFDNLMIAPAGLVGAYGEKPFREGTSYKRKLGVIISNTLMIDDNYQSGFDPEISESDFEPKLTPKAPTSTMNILSQKLPQTFGYQKYFKGNRTLSFPTDDSKSYETDITKKRNQNIQGFKVIREEASFHLKKSTTKFYPTFVKRDLLIRQETKNQLNNLKGKVSGGKNKNLLEGMRFADSLSGESLHYGEKSDLSASTWPSSAKKVQTFVKQQQQLNKSSLFFKNQINETSITQKQKFTYNFLNKYPAPVSIIKYGLNWKNPFKLIYNPVVSPSKLDFLSKKNLPPPSGVNGLPLNIASSEQSINSKKSDYLASIKNINSSSLQRIFWIPQSFYTFSLTKLCFFSDSSLPEGSKTAWSTLPKTPTKPAGTAMGITGKAIKASAYTAFGNSLSGKSIPYDDVENKQSNFINSFLQNSNGSINSILQKKSSSDGFKFKTKQILKKSGQSNFAVGTCGKKISPKLVKTLKISDPSLGILSPILPRKIFQLNRQGRIKKLDLGEGYFQTIKNTCNNLKKVYMFNPNLSPPQRNLPSLSPGMQAKGLEGFSTSKFGQLFYNKIPNTKIKIKIVNRNSLNNNYLYKTGVSMRNITKSINSFSHMGSPKKHYPLGLKKYQISELDKIKIRTCIFGTNHDNVKVQNKFLKNLFNINLKNLLSIDVNLKKSSHNILFKKKKGRLIKLPSLWKVLSTEGTYNKVEPKYTLFERINSDLLSRIIWLMSQYSTLNIKMPSTKTPIRSLLSWDSSISSVSFAKSISYKTLKSFSKIISFPYFLNKETLFFLSSKNLPTYKKNQMSLFNFNFYNFFNKDNQSLFNFGLLNNSLVENNDHVPTTSVSLESLESLESFESRSVGNQRLSFPISPPAPAVLVGAFDEGGGKENFKASKKFVYKDKSIILGNNKKKNPINEYTKTKITGPFQSFDFDITKICSPYLKNQLKYLFSLVSTFKSSNKNKGISMSRFAKGKTYEGGNLRSLIRLPRKSHDRVRQWDSRPPKRYLRYAVGRTRVKFSKSFYNTGYNFTKKKKNQYVNRQSHENKQSAPAMKIQPFKVGSYSSRTFKILNFNNLLSNATFLYSNINFIYKKGFFYFELQEPTFTACGKAVAEGIYRGANNFFDNQFEGVQKNNIKFKMADYKHFERPFLDIYDKKSFKNCNLLTDNKNILNNLSIQTMIEQRRKNFQFCLKKSTFLKKEYFNRLSMEDSVIRFNLKKRLYSYLFKKTSNFAPQFTPTSFSQALRLPVEGFRHIVKNSVPRFRRLSLVNKANILQKSLITPSKRFSFEHQVQKEDILLQGSLPPSINFIIKPSWPYFTKSIPNYILYNKKLIKSGKVIGDELIFDRESIFLEIISFNEMISFLTLNDNLSKSYFAYKPYTLLLNSNLQKVGFQLRDANKSFKAIYSPSEIISTDASAPGLPNYSPFTPPPRGGIYTPAIEAPAKSSKDKYTKDFEAPDMGISEPSGISKKQRFPSDIKKTNFWVTKSVIKNKKSRYFYVNLEKFKNFDMSATSKDTTSNQRPFAVGGSPSAIISQVPSVGAYGEKTIGGVNSTLKNCFFEHSNDQKFFILLRSVNEYKVVKDSVYKKEIFKIANKKPECLSPIFLQKDILFSKKSRDYLTAEMFFRGTKKMLNHMSLQKDFNQSSSTKHPLFRIYNERQFIFKNNWKNKNFVRNKIDRTYNHNSSNYRFALNTSFNTINLFSQFKTELLNKQKISSQTISKFPVSSLQVFSNSSFYSFIILKQKLTKETSFFRKTSENLSTVSTKTHKFKSLTAFPALRSPGSLPPVTEGPAMRLSAKVFSTNSNHNTTKSFIENTTENLSLRFLHKKNKVKSYIEYFEPITAISSINLSPLVLSSKFSYAFDYLFKIPVYSFSEQFNLKFILEKSSLDKTKNRGDFSSGPNINSHVFQSIDNSLEDFADTEDSSVNFHPIKKFLNNYLFKIHNLKKFKKSNNGVATILVPKYSSKSSNDSLYLSPPPFTPPFGGGVSPPKAPSAAYIYPPFGGVLKGMEVPAAKGRDIGKTSKTFANKTHTPSANGAYGGDGESISCVSNRNFRRKIHSNILNLYKVTSILPSFFYCPVAEYCLGANLEKTLLEGSSMSNANYLIPGASFSNNLTTPNFFPPTAFSKAPMSKGFQISSPVMGLLAKSGIGINGETMLNPYFKSNINNIYNKKFLTKKYSFSLSNRKIGFILASLNNFLDFRFKYRINKEFLYYKTEFESFRNNHVLSNGCVTSSFINTYTYCSFEGEFIFISTSSLSEGKAADKSSECQSNFNAEKVPSLFRRQIDGYATGKSLFSNKKDDNLKIKVPFAEGAYGGPETSSKLNTINFEESNLLNQNQALSKFQQNSKQTFKTSDFEKAVGEQDIHNLKKALFVNKNLIDSCMILTKNDLISYYLKNTTGFSPFTPPLKGGGIRRAAPRSPYIPPLRGGIYTPAIEAPTEGTFGKITAESLPLLKNALVTRKKRKLFMPKALPFGSSLPPFATGTFGVYPPPQGGGDIGGIKEVENYSWNNNGLKFNIKYYSPFFLKPNFDNTSYFLIDPVSENGSSKALARKLCSRLGLCCNLNYKEIYFSLETLKKKNQYLINDTVIKFLNILDSKEETNLFLSKVLFSSKNKTETVAVNDSMEPETNLSEFNFKINNLPMGISQQTNQLLLGELLVYGDQISSYFSITKPGQIIHINNNKLTIRKGQSIFVSPKAILHKYDTDFIDEQSPVITLSYQQLKTGDIIEGIPKVEQFFEARTTKRGRLFRDSLSNLLKGLFKRYCSRGQPLDQAVRQSFYKIQQIIVDGVQRVYRSQGVGIADKHLEVIVKQMTSKVRIIEGGQTGFFPGEVVDLNVVEEVNSLLMRKISYEPLVLGITKASLEVDSFLSAASFQQTTRVLSNAAISKKKDFLKGLKENVILGNLIPAGTGYLVYLIP